MVCASEMIGHGLGACIHSDQQSPQLEVDAVLHVERAVIGKDLLDFLLPQPEFLSERWTVIRKRTLISDEQNRSVSVDLAYPLHCGGSGESRSGYDIFVS